MITKYTTDGKKVVIIGSLNAKETIVQEIFVTESGDEIPSGENFMVKSLHDEPVVSWEEKSIEKIKQSLEEMRIKEQLAESNYWNTVNKFEEKARSVRESIDLLSVDVFDRVVDFISQKYKFFVTLKYGDPQILTAVEFYNEELPYCTNGRRNVEGLKLITLYGKDRSGKIGFEWELNEYPSGSSSSCTIIPCYTKEDALEISQDIINDKNKFDDDDINFLKKHNLPIDSKKYNEHISEQKRVWLDRIKHNDEESQNYKKKIKDLDK